MIIVIVNKEKIKYSNSYEEIISHGVDIETGEFITLPNLPPSHLNLKFDAKVGEYVL